MFDRTSRLNLLLAICLGIVLGLLSYARIIGDSQTVVFSNEVLDTIFATSLWGTRLMWNIVGFAAALLLLHSLFGVLCWLVGTVSAAVAGGDPASRAKTQRQHVVLWFALLTIAVLANNSAHFPRSSFGSPYARVATTEIGGVMIGSWIAGLIVLGAVVVLIVAGLGVWRRGWRPFSRPRALMVGSAAVVILAGCGWATANRTHNHTAPGRPNVVLIGIDSLRADIIAPYASKDLVPHVREFMRGSVWFSDAMTPLARTFPSMMSIFTGRHPHSTGAYMNLPPRDAIHEGDTLGRMLGRQGYRSVYAMDEVRFANIDTSYGFDQVITPPIGASEFLLSLIADTPLSNSVMNSVIGKLLFPHVYANRGAAATYDPDKFVDRIDHEVDFGGPLFFSAHLTLAHWPYSWGDSPLPGPKTDALLPDYYVHAVNRVDRQFADVMAVLRKRGVLDNAIVVVYSDHGESFGKPLESLVPVKNGLIQALSAVPQWGHGSSVLSSHQFKVVLGMRGFGSAASLLPEAREIKAPVSVMDIAPTLAQLTGARAAAPFDGLSLVPLLHTQSTPVEFQHRVRYTETEYTPVGVATSDGRVSASVISQAAQLYLIDPETDRLEVRREHLVPMIGIRQFAAVGDELLLAALPYRAENLTHHFIVFDKSGGIPQLISATPGAESPAELRRLWEGMQTHFKGIVPTGEQLEAVVADSPVAQQGH